MSRKRTFCIGEEIAFLPEQLFFARKKAGLTLRQAGELTGFQVSNISTWENGRTKPNSSTLIRLAKAYNATIVISFQEEHLTAWRQITSASYWQE